MRASERLPLYRDGRVYDAMNRAVTADVPFYVAEAKAANGPVLELACGTGRLTIPVAENGVEIVGLDSSPSMLEHAGQVRTPRRQFGEKESARRGARRVLFRSRNR